MAAAATSDELLVAELVAETASVLAEGALGALAELLLVDPAPAVT